MKSVNSNLSIFKFVDDTIRNFLLRFQEDECLLFHFWVLKENVSARNVKYILNGTVSRITLFLSYFSQILHYKKTLLSFVLCALPDVWGFQVSCQSQKLPLSWLSDTLLRMCAHPATRGTVLCRKPHPIWCPSRLKQTPRSVGQTRLEPGLTAKPRWCSLGWQTW